VNSETGEIVAFGRPGLTNIANFPQTQLNAEEANPDKETGADTMPKQIEITTALCAAISATDENAVTAAGVVDHINSQADTITQLNAEIERLKDPANFRPAADVENLETQLNAAQDKLKGFRDQEIKALIEGAVADGKIAPASVGHYTALCASDEGLKQVQGIIGTAITATPNADGKPAGEVDDEDTDLNASNEAIANEFGVSAEAAAAARQSLFPN
jgi:phage I-like protein